MINETLQILPSSIESMVIESGLHLHPDRLRSILQTTIDKITAHTETVTLGNELCSMWVIGLKAVSSTLVIPRMDDCIAMFLGSQSVYKKVLDQKPGTYFLSKGWIDGGITIVDELERMEKRYGRNRTERIMKRMLQYYRRLAFIDMGYEDCDKYQEFSRAAAKRLRLEYREIMGTPEFLRKIYNGPWDHEFVIVPPAHAVRLEAFER